MCTPSEQAVLGLEPDDLAFADQLDEAAKRFDEGDEQAVLTVVEGMELEGHPERIPRPVNPRTFTSAALRQAATFLRAGDTAAARVQLLELRAMRTERLPWSAFFSWDHAGEVQTASEVAGEALPKAKQALLPAENAWQVIWLREPLKHPSGATIRFIPVIPEGHVGPKSPWRRHYSQLAVSTQRLSRLIDLAAPDFVIAGERRILTEHLQKLVALASTPQPTPPWSLHRPRKRPLALEYPPTTPARQGLFRMPYHYPYRYIVQRADRLEVRDERGVHQLPACAWRPVFAGTRHVAFVGEVRSGAVTRGVAVLDTEECRWLDSWPMKGRESLSYAWLPETDREGAWWLVDPRGPLSRLLPGRPVAHTTSKGREQLVLGTDGGLVLTAPKPDGLEQTVLELGEESPTWRVDTRTGEILETPWEPWDETPSAGLNAPWQPTTADLAGLAWSAHGQLICWRGALYIDGVRTLLLDGPVLDVALTGGNASRNGELVILTDKELLEFSFEGPGEESGSISLKHRLSLV